MKNAVEMIQNMQNSVVDFGEHFDIRCRKTRNEGNFKEDFIRKMCRKTRNYF